MGGHHTLLVVEDSPTERHILETLLKRHHYRVLSVESAEEGADILSCTSVDAVLMDIVLPGMNGFQAIRHYRKEGLLPPHTPIVICTTKSTESDRAWGLRQGAQWYLTKPIQETELLSVLQSLLQRQPDTQAAPA
jgi:twitching motility two-component system response regulator PilH